MCLVELWNKLCYVFIKSFGCPVVKYDCHISCVGNVVIQARVTTGEDEAFRASVVLPLWKWIRLDCYIQDSKVWKLSMCLGDKEQKLK